MNKEQFLNECNNIGIIINEEKLNKLELYKNELQEWNKKINLTTIIDDNYIYLKHFYDSLCVVKATNFNNKKICDFGTGAGFPGMVLAIVFDNSTFVLLESNGKKVSFLENLVKKLNIKNVTIINERVENYGRKNRDIFDIVTCRAVSNLNIIVELSISLLKVDGLFIPLKSNVEDELKNSEKKYKMLGYDLKSKIDYELPFEKSKRTLLIFRKISKTEIKYPRNYNIIKKENSI